MIIFSKAGKFVSKAKFKSSWEKDGITRYNTEIIASTMKMLGSRYSERGYNPPKTSGAMPESLEGPTVSDPKPEEDKIPF